jgi:hypothetical protein
VQHLEKEVREYLRASEILIALLKTGKALSREEMGYIETYTMRIQCLQNANENSNAHITVRLKRDSADAS